MEEVEKRFNDRKEKESAEAVWKELKEAVEECAEKHLQRRRQPQRQWLSADTIGYLTLCKQVRRATRADKEKWWDEKMTELEEDMKHNRQGDFSRN